MVTTICGGVQQTFDRSMLDGEEVRVHRCAHIPCSADYPASKYGMQGRPLHVQPFVPAPVLETLELFSPVVAVTLHDEANIAVAELEMCPEVYSIFEDIAWLTLPKVKYVPIPLLELEAPPPLIALGEDVLPLVLVDALLPIVPVPVGAIELVESPGAAPLRCVLAAQPLPIGANEVPVLRDLGTLTSALLDKPLDMQPGVQKLGLLGEIFPLAREI